MIKCVLSIAWVLPVICNLIQVVILVTRKNHAAIWLFSYTLLQVLYLFKSIGFGVDQLLDNTVDTYWQSDGPQPHLVNIQFRRKTTIHDVCIYTDYKADESYTPNRLIKFIIFTCMYMYLLFWIFFFLQFSFQKFMKTTLPW